MNILTIETPVKTTVMNGVEVSILEGMTNIYNSRSSLNCLEKQTTVTVACLWISRFYRAIFKGSQTPFLEESPSYTSWTIIKSIYGQRWRKPGRLWFSSTWAPATLPSLHLCFAIPSCWGMQLADVYAALGRSSLNKICRITMVPLGAPLLKHELLSSVFITD